MMNYICKFTTFKPIKPTNYFNKALVHFEINLILMCISKIKYNPDYNIITKAGNLLKNLMKQPKLIKTNKLTLLIQCSILQQKIL